MCHAKSRGGSGSGVTGLLTNYNAYQRWVCSTHARSQYLNATLQMVGLLPEYTDKHKDARTADICKSETHVQKAKDAIESFMNPFDIEGSDVVILSSGASATKEVTCDLLRGESAGQEAKDKFVTSRLQTGKNFFEPITRLKCKTLENMSKSVKVTSKKKLLQYKQQDNIAFQLFVKCHNTLNSTIDLKALLKYPLTPVPYSLATADGFFAKTNKAKAFHYIAKDVADGTPPPQSETLTLHDGNAVFYCMKEVPGNFREISLKLFDMMGKGDVIFSTDSYHPGSIKTVERQRRGTTEKFIIRGGSTKRPSDWKGFLANDCNKKQFIELLVQEWSKDEYAKKLQGREVTLIDNGVAYLLTSVDGCKTTKSVIQELESSQEETDTRVILYLQHAQNKGYRCCVVKSPDTDIFFILLYFACKLQYY